MWILFLIATFTSVVAFNTKHQRFALLIITFLATSGFQLISARWFASPVVLSKPHDYAYLAIFMIFLVNINSVVRTIASSRITKVATGYLGFIILVLIASIALLDYAPVQAFQAARVFLWPIFLLLFLLTEPKALDQFVNTLKPIVIVLSILYLLQPITGTNIINPDSYYFNPYLGGTNLKRYLATPDFLIFFVMLFYYDICLSKSKSIGVKLANWLGLVLLLSVQLVSFTRSAILATGLVVVYLSSRLLNTVMVVLVLAFALGGMAVAYSTSYTIENRVDESLKDIISSLEGNFVTFRAQTDGNLAFRLAHLNERMSYVADDIKRWPIGVGFIHEDSAVAQALGFKTGLPNPLTGRAFQVDTGDIAWSVIVIKTGFVGLCLLLLFLLISYFSVGPSIDKYAVVYRGGLLYFIVTSFFSINFSTPSYMIPLMLFLALAINATQQPTNRDVSRQ